MDPRPTEGLLSRLVLPRRKRAATYRERLQRASTTPFLYDRGRAEALPAHAPTVSIQTGDVPEVLPIQVALAGEPSACLTAVADAAQRALGKVSASAEIASRRALSLGQQERMARLLGQLQVIQAALPDATRPPAVTPSESGWGHAVTALADALKDGADWLSTLVATQPEAAPARHVGDAAEAFLRRHHAELVANTSEELD